MSCKCVSAMWRFFCGAFTELAILGKNILKSSGEMSRLSFLTANIVSLDEYEKKLRMVHSQFAEKTKPGTTMTSK